MEKSNNNSNKAVVSWQCLLGFFLKNFFKIIICCLIAVPIAFGVDYLLSGRKFEKNYAEWNESYNLENAKLNSLKMQLKSMQSYQDNSLLLKLDPNNVAHHISAYKVLSDDESYLISENVRIVSEKDVRASKILAFLNSSDLSSILDESIPSKYLSELISFSADSSYINVRILAESEEKALDWSKKIDAFITSIDNIEKVSTSTYVSFDKDVNESIFLTSDTINEIVSQVIESEKKIENLLNSKPAKIHLLRDPVFGLFAGFVIAFLLFSYYPTISGKLCSSRDVCLVADAPLLGTVSQKGKKGLYNSVVGEKIFSSQEQENNYFKSCIKSYSSGKNSILFISCETITQKDRFDDIAKTCEMNSILVDNALLNPVFFSSLKDDQIVVLIAFDYKTTRQNVNDVRTLLRTCGRDIDGVICIL